jgi:glycosyltransferase involved in cell wall biosynthesis
MRIGVAIPCYKYHIPLLKRCLDSIEQQTRKPDEVVVSCSSSTEVDLPTYSVSFPLRILCRETRHNAAENRNYAASHLTTDIVSFFDCDDIMHPERLAELERCGDADIVLHSYVSDTDPFPPWDPSIQVHNLLRKSPTGCAILATNCWAPIHHAHVTVKRSVWNAVRFREESEWERREDSLFCGDVLSRPTIQSVYLPYPLSRYLITGHTIVDEYLMK